MRLIARTDANQAEIVADLRKAGVSVLCLHRVGSGCPDILCGTITHNADGTASARNYLFEIKTVGGRMTHDEAEFFAAWRGQCAVIGSAEDALEVMNAEEA